MTLLSASPEQGFNMYIHDELAEDAVLGIPYFKHKPGAHSYINLREHPELISEIPELKDCPPLLNIVAALNGLSSPLETFGCDKGLQDWSNPQFPGCVSRYGSYLDVAFVTKQMCSKENYQNLIREFREYAAAKHINGFHKMMHVFFSLRPTVSLCTQHWWTLCIQNYGVVRDEKEANTWWGQCVHRTQDFLLTSLEARD
jgi:hypothetical protein